MRDRFSLAAWLIVAAVVVAIDQVTKALVENALPLGASVYVFPVLDLVHVRNTGAAFSFLAGAWAGSGSFSSGSR